MLIGELAQRSGVAPGAIRFYERHQLLAPPSRSASGYRLYPDRVVRELEFIKTAQGIGFSLGEIREILALGRGGRVPCDRVITACETHLADIARRMAELELFQTRLRQTLEQAQGNCGSSTEGFCNAILAVAPCE